MFNLQPFLDAANELTRLDEIERALNLLDNLPAEYRDNEPPEVTALRSEITQRIATPSYYAEAEAKFEIGDVAMANTLRYQMLIADVKDLNSRGLTPHIVDYGPGPLWLPARLLSDGFKFTYWPIVLDPRVVSMAEEAFPGIVERTPSSINPYIFCAFEIIEHLWNEIDLKIEAYRYSPQLPNIIHISTPCYAFDPGCTDWRQRDRLGHLRAYTPKELCIVLGRLFGQHSLRVYKHQIMHARLTLPGGAFEIKDMEVKE